MSREVYVSVDIESDGPIPGDYSMLSLGAAAFDQGGKMLGTFTVNLELLPGAKQDPDTMKWWAGQGTAYAEATSNPKPCVIGMRDFARWVEQLPGKPVFVGYPTGFDFTFVYWYLVHHGVRSPFSFSALDMKSYAAALMGGGYRDVSKREMVKRWPLDKSVPHHSHVAVEDAIEQGHLFMAMLREAQR